MVKLLIIPFLLFSLSAHASVDQVENYLSSLKTMTANFTQIAPDGTISTGKFQLKRPKKMRWQYNPPTPILMVTRSNYLTYYDYELDQVSDIPLDDTLLSVLSNQEIDFENGNTNVIYSAQEGGKFVVSIEQKDAPDNGNLTLIFTQAPMQLSQMIITDATQQQTLVTLENIQEDTPLDDKVFFFRDPRIGGRNKKNDHLN